jgi:hypothetical protein
MSNGVWRRCSCPRCTIRSLMGPTVVITIGLLFLLQQMADAEFGFGNTYPFILIVIGVILLASSIAPTTGHVDAVVAPPGPPAPGAPQAPASGQGR